MLWGRVTSPSGAPFSFIELRKLAVNSVARQRGIDPGTVSDKFRRQLLPHIDGTTAFDELAESWLAAGSPNLYNALSHHAVEESDRARLRAFFRDHSRGVEINASAT